MKKNSLPSFICFTLLLLATQAGANIKLPVLFQSNMVLQRDKDCRIWGTADPGEAVSLQFNNNTYKATTGKDGKWKITIPPQQAGGPYQLVFTGKNTITLDNVLFGDIWICGGQSNMQFHINEVAPKETDSVRDANPNIRIFTAGLATDYVPRDTLSSGQWRTTSLENIQGFSAVGFYFGRYLQENTKVPIGLIADNLGATAVETWMSPEAIKQFPQFDGFYNAYLGPKKTMKQLGDEFDKIKASWEKDYYLKDDPGLTNEWYKPTTDTSDWKPIRVPGYWEDKELPNYDGSVWFRRSFDLPDNYKGEGFRISLGQVDDYNITWVNGHKVGETMGNLNSSGYNIPDSFLRAKNNTLVVRIFDAGGKGGMYNMFWDPRLAGQWLYKPGRKIDPATFKKALVPNSYLFGSPSILYNGCIAPVTQLAIKGAIWYQGESNAGRAEEYKQLFPAMIKDWRKQFNQGDFPFFFVQLANFNAEPTTPGTSEWAELREAQNTALALPNTGLAVAIDIGEAFDIHPRNKLDVGKRLGIAALKTAYGWDTTHTTPMYDHMETSNDSIIIHFKDAELVGKDKYGYIRGFSIAGKDSVFHWAKAFIRNNTLVVYSDEVKAPLAARYAWAYNPGPLDLYSKQGLPVSPFRTDNWPMVTGGKKFEYTF